MAYHHLALAAKDMKATHKFYEEVMGFELVKVEVGPVAGGGWSKHFFYRMNGNNDHFIAFWDLNDMPEQDKIEYNLNKAANLPRGINHYAFNVDSFEELNEWRSKWNDAGLEVLEIDHNWCHSIYTMDPNGNAIEFCLTTGSFTAADRERALEVLDETKMNPTTGPAKTLLWKDNESTDLQAAAE